MSFKLFKPVNSLADFLERLKEVRLKWRVDRGAKTKGEETQLWYRGQEKASWRLTPKYYRNEFLEADEDEIQIEFDSRGRQVYQNGLPKDLWERYFLMQHYGAPTRLLDWTDNPLVALFFAVDRFEKLGAASHSADQQEDAAVWILDPGWLNKQLGKKVAGPLLPDWPEAKPYLLEPFSQKEIRVRKPAAIDPPHVDRRLAIQGSRFIIFGRTRDLTKILAVERRSCRLAKIPVDRESVEKGKITRELEVCGITWGQLFSDLEGLCKDIRRKWRTTKSD